MLLLHSWRRLYRAGHSAGVRQQYMLRYVGGGIKTPAQSAASKVSSVTTACSGGSLEMSPPAMHVHDARGGDTSQQESDRVAVDASSELADRGRATTAPRESGSGSGLQAVQSGASGPKLVSLRSMVSNKYSSSLADTEDSMMHSFQQADRAAEASNRRPMHVALLPHDGHETAGSHRTGAKTPFCSRTTQLLHLHCT